MKNPTLQQIEFKEDEITIIVPNESFIPLLSKSLSEANYKFRNRIMDLLGKTTFPAVIYIRWKTAPMFSVKHIEN